MTQSKNTKQLIVKDLSYTYTDQAQPTGVLKKINAKFAPGKLYAIKGESGSGKTTLLSLISALDKTQGGDITYGKESVREISLSAFRLKYVSIVFQSYNLIKYMTARENVQVAIDFAGRKNDNPQKYLKQVGLTETESKRLVNKLSGGEQQRVAIARALATKSPIIVADEPTGNLDEKTEGKIIKIFQDLAHKEGKIVIIVTHSQKVAKHADSVLTLARGKLSSR